MSGLYEFSPLPGQRHDLVILVRFAKGTDPRRLLSELRSLTGGDTHKLAEAKGRTWGLTVSVAPSGVDDHLARVEAAIDVHGSTCGGAAWGAEMIEARLCPCPSSRQESGAAACLEIALRPGENHSGQSIFLRRGRAFGTGEHPSTQLALQALEDFFAGPRSGSGLEVLDVGCGTGVLAIAAARLGAAKILAVDCDGEAIAEARRNVSLNRLSRRIRLEQAAPPMLDGSYHLICANVAAAALHGMVQDLPRLLRGDGHLIVSGIQARQEADLLARFERAGLRAERPAYRMRTWRAWRLKAAG